MRRTWWEKSFGYVFALPMTLVGMVFAIFYQPKGWRWCQGCLECWGTKRMIGDPDAQTWGFLICYRDLHHADAADLRVHERCHVRQGMRGSVLFALVYGLQFLWFLAFPRAQFAHYRKRWFRAYMSISFEMAAYSRQARYWQWKAQGEMLFRAYCFTAWGALPVGSNLELT